MNLREWMFRNKKKVTELAQELDTSRPNLNMIVLGKKTPSAKLAKKIEEATKGEVTLRELLFPEEYKEKE
jgi:DNA-binding transcriptional regulator YdaS (Cro superfamily)